MPVELLAEAIKYEFMAYLHGFLDQYQERLLTGQRNNPSIFT